MYGRGRPPPAPTGGGGSWSYNQVAPPSNFKPQNNITPAQGMAMVMNNRKRRAFGEDDDDYFDSDEEQQPVDKTTKDLNDDLEAAVKEDNDEDEEDPLDAFMAGLEKDIKTEAAKPQSAKKPKEVRHDIDEADDEESYYKYMEENPLAGVANLSDDEEANQVEYDQDGNPIVIKKEIEPLPRIDHSQIDYHPFNKNFYEEHEDIKSLDYGQVQQLRKTLGLRIFGPDPPKPVTSFAHFGFDEQLMKVIRKCEYSQPTPIQAQAVPLALGGRDIIGIAKTGSGKTAAYLWPMIVSVMDQPDLKVGDGPIGLILAPTRELSQQIYTEAKKFGRTYNIRVVCAYGGGSKWEQSKDLELGAEIVVATPGRLIDLVKMKATNLRRVTMLVLDEADKMFQLGFEPQVRSICDHVRPDRQTMLFSATFKKRIEKLARDVLTDPVKIVQGDTGGEANQDIQQHVLVFPEGSEKWQWLTDHLVEFTSAGSVLIFVTRKANADELHANLLVKQIPALLIHGDMGQATRNEVITAFKRRDKDILVATDVAARGLDISHIRTVVNYDVARDIDTHTHRIGRTGRAGEKGDAYTLVTDKDKEFVGHLVRNLEGANQPVPDALMNLAMQSNWFRSSRFKSGQASHHSSGRRVGGAGLGYKEKSRPGFGSGPGHSAPPPSSHPGTSRPAASSDRGSSVKAAYAAGYMSRFKAATDTAWKQEPPPQQASKKKSRWDN